MQKVEGSSPFSRFRDTPGAEPRTGRAPKPTALRGGFVVIVAIQWQTPRSEASRGALKRPQGEDPHAARSRLSATARLAVGVGGRIGTRAVRPLRTLTRRG